jgi:hypothetical protein
MGIYSRPARAAFVRIEFHSVASRPNGLNVTSDLFSLSNYQNSHLFQKIIFFRWVDSI